MQRPAMNEAGYRPTSTKKTPNALASFLAGFIATWIFLVPLGYFLSKPPLPKPQSPPDVAVTVPDIAVTVPDAAVTVPAEKPMEPETVEVQPPADDFAVFGGDWIFEDDGSVSADVDDGPKLVCLHPDFQDMKSGEVSVEMFTPKSNRQGQAGIVIKVNEPGIGCDSFVGYSIGSCLEDRRLNIGLHRNNYRELQQPECNIPVDQWFTLHILFEETSFEVRVDGKTITKYEDKSPEVVRSGGIAFRPFYRFVKYRNLKIRNTTDDRQSAEWTTIPLRAPMKYVQEKGRPQKVREKLLTIPDAKLKMELSAQPGVWYGRGQFTPDGKKFVVASVVGEAIKWNVFDLATKKLLTSFDHPGQLAGMDIHPDGRMFAMGIHDEYVFRNLENGEILKKIKTFNGNLPVFSNIRFSPDGSFFLGSTLQTIASWDTATGERRRQFEGHEHIIYTADISSDGKRAATSSFDGTVRIWDIETGQGLFCLRGHSSKIIHGLAFNHQGTVLASGARDGIVVLWDTKTGTPIKRLIGCGDEVTGLAFSPDDKQLVLGCNREDSSAVWDVETGLPLYRLPAPNEGGNFRTATFSKDGKMIALCMCNDPMKIWEVPTTEELARMEQELKIKRETAREILLREMPPPEHAQVGYDDTRRWDTFESSQEKHENSLWAHAPSRFAFRLDKRWKTFKTQFGLISCTDMNVANVVFIVKGDGKELFRSGEIRDIIARPLEVNVSDVELLELIVDPNGPKDYDQAIWFTPMLLRDSVQKPQTPQTAPPKENPAQPVTAPKANPAPSVEVPKATPAPTAEALLPLRLWPGKKELAWAPADYLDQVDTVLEEVGKKGFAVAGQITETNGFPMKKGTYIATLKYDEKKEADVDCFDNGWFIKQVDSYRDSCILTVKTFQHEEVEIPLKAERRKINSYQIFLERIHITKLAALKGTVQDEKNRPIINAMVQLRIDPPNGTNNRAMLRSLTDSDGRYSFSGITPQEYGLSISPSSEQYLFAPFSCKVCPGDDQTKLVLEKSHDERFRQEEDEIVSTIPLPRKVTIDTLYQPDGSTDFTRNNVITGRYELTFVGFGNDIAKGNKRTGNRIIFDPREKSTQYDLSLDFGEKLEFRHSSTRDRGSVKDGYGHYDLGEVDFDSVKAADPAKIQVLSSPCELNHVYVVGTNRKGHYAKFVVRSVEILAPPRKK